MSLPLICFRPRYSGLKPSDRLYATQLHETVSISISLLTMESYLLLYLTTHALQAESNRPTQSPVINPILVDSEV